MNQGKEKQLKIIPLGGLGEIGKNMTIFEWDSKIIIVDMGLKMPSDSVPGIDYIIPDISYLEKRKNDILGILFTHGHYDHIGAIPYIIEKIGNPPIFASTLTRGIILKRQDDFPMNPKLKIEEISSGSKIKLGPFKIDFFHLNHSIIGNLGMLIETPVGKIVHTSDFKFDETPINDKPTDFQKLKEIGSRKIDLLMIDSTGAEQEGHSLSEKVIMKNLDEIFLKSKGRIIVATFSSLINRMQQIIALSEKYGRKVFIEGGGMKANMEICRKLKYIITKKGTIIRSKNISDYPDSKITVICTGAQGEDRAALKKISDGRHKDISFKKGDTIILSSSIVPGNERSVQELKDDILKQGTRIFHYKMMDIHAGGHAHQDEIKKMIKIMNPRYLFPVHGQYSMFIAMKHMAIEKLNFSEKNIIIAENGNIVNLSKNGASLSQKKVPSSDIMVDGLGVGDIGEVVLNDRKALAEDGMFVIIAVVDRETGKIKGSPDIISRGFVYLRESKNLLHQTRKKTIQIIDASNKDKKEIKSEIKEKVEQFLYQKTERKPMVLPVIIEV
ncbi:MAG: ribonuclease J [Candidatus Pacebacteria bacterium]|nr:ribonuclease J [Candidatus Paceibacterota bacterium]